MVKINYLWSLHITYRKGITADVKSLLDLTRVTDKVCRIKVDGHDEEVVHLVIEKQRFFAMVAGGLLVEVDHNTFLELQASLKTLFFSERQRRPGG